MRITPTLTWVLDGDPPFALDARLLPLLDAVARSGSLSAAVIARGVSYRAAWGLLRDYERIFGAPLVALERGRGARLAPAGARIVEAHRNAERRLTRVLPALGVEVARKSGKSDGGRVRSSHVARLRIAASHDLALTALRDALTSEARIALEIIVMGSLHALQQFHEGRVELAGFHVAIGRRAATDLAAFHRLLSPRRDRLIHIVDREQGLILPRRNPARIHGFADLASKGLRFVNRQSGSGTRVLIDRVLAEEGVDASALAGYGNEELTHAAVAANVASGAADAGFGLRAAAAQYGLAFVPRVRERYYLAVRASALVMPGVVRLIEMLRGPTFARVVHALPGYRAAGPGAVTGIEVLGRGASREMR
jgi:molybdate transport repressor ModE-like protein